MGNRTYTPDAEFVLADPSTGLTATDVPQSGGVDLVVKVGNGRLEAVAIIDIVSCEIASNDELYTFTIQGGDAEAFDGDIENLAMLDFGATEVRHGGAIDTVAGRYELEFCNQQGDVTYPYVRLHVTVAGTIDTTGIVFGAFVGADD